MPSRLLGSFLIVWRSLTSHVLSTVVTVGSVALGCGLVMAIFSIQSQSRGAFADGDVGFDAVLGARGSHLQLVLNTVFHLETSPGNIPWSLYQTIQKDRRVKLAVPYAVGDNYFGFRIVGTTEEIFTAYRYRGGRSFAPQKGGRFFRSDRREAVVGATVARELGLAIRDVVHPYHGIEYDPEKKHAEEYVVVGVLEPTNTPADRVVWIPIEGIFRMSGHVLRGSGEEFEATAGEAIPDEHKEVSAVMLKLAKPRYGFALSNTINRQGNVATLAWPIARVMTELFDKLGWIHRILEVLGYLVVLVAAATILASIYNTMNERRREFAILRALGARRRTVWSVILLESTSIAVLGSLLGYLVYGGILAAAAAILKSQTGVVLDLLEIHPILWITPLGMAGLGALAGLLPAFVAYSTDVSSHLS